MADLHRRPGSPTTTDLVRADVVEELREIAQGLEVFWEPTSRTNEAKQALAVTTASGADLDPEHAAEALAVLNQLDGMRRGLAHRVRLVADKLDGTRVL